MKKRIRIILSWPWFKIFIISAIFVFLLIQWGDFNVRRLDAYTNCIKTYEKESCRQGFSISNIFSF